MKELKVGHKYILPVAMVPHKKRIRAKAKSKALGKRMAAGGKRCMVFPFVHKGKNADVNMRALLIYLHFLSGLTPTTLHLAPILL